MILLSPNSDTLMLAHIEIYLHKRQQHDTQSYCLSKLTRDI